MAEGVRSGLAHWIGGASSPPFTPPPPPVVVGGVRSLLAFWMGGASSPAFTPPPPVTTTSIHGADEQIEEFDARKHRLAMLRREDDLVVETIMNAVVRGMLN